MDNIKAAHPEHPIGREIAQRWSPCAFDSRSVAREDLLSIFEAARWAASSRNEQPWRYIVATKERPEEFERLLTCLTKGNQVWAGSAPVLALGVVSLRFARNGRPNDSAHHDLGLASATLTLEATRRDLYIHQMRGILPDIARDLYAIPSDFAAFTGLAIGYPGDPETLPADIRERDLAPRSRRPLREFVFSGSWGTPGLEG